MSTTWILLILGPLFLERLLLVCLVLVSVLILVTSHLIWAVGNEVIILSIMATSSYWLSFVELATIDMKNFYFQVCLELRHEQIKLIIIILLLLHLWIVQPPSFLTFLSQLE